MPYNQELASKKLSKRLQTSRIISTFAAHFAKTAQMRVDPLAQQVEHNTFNVGVLGSSPKRITEKEATSLLFPYHSSTCSYSRLSYIA